MTPRPVARADSASTAPTKRGRPFPIMPPDQFHFTTAAFAFCPFNACLLLSALIPPPALLPFPFASPVAISACSRSRHGARAAVRS